ncbi:ribonuclease J [Magnetospira sp. QH-2]|uniref:ribonuclease J n=1 Tax=Magnetospira sp. (strain QH-2) TaxID=1288970 RepID=UPI0003E8182C|nr:ribonuclease J [Magnetospira sp. QH-2]CCQ73861.1 Putative hydrolase of the metallo-beta-lactamase superfamily [Magnetospira sp. QH-2]
MGDGVYWLPLGGAGEIGMNVYLYGLGPEEDPEWLMVDCGITFGNGTVPGVDVILPEIAWIEERRHRLVGLVLTHAHEDHLGAVHHLWKRLQCPVYATPFAASVLKTKLSEAGLKNKVPLTEIPLSGAFEVGPFKLQYVTMTHSIPEPNLLMIDTPHGRIAHSGDFKFDPNPVIGEPADEKTLKSFGDMGVTALVADSTNVLTEGDGESEADLLKDLTRIIGEAEGQVAVTCFATNVARLRTICAAAEATGRDVCLVGRSLHKMSGIARSHGLLDGVPGFIGEKEAGYIPEDKLLYICTGCQGEPRGALSRISNDAHRDVKLKRGALVIFSSRIIPGNELSVQRIQNALVRHGMKVLTWRDAHVHVSGHPARGELKKLYDLLRPDILVPMHGESIHLREQAQWALDCGVPESLVAENGNMVRLAPNGPAIVDEVPVGRWGLDGQRAIAFDGDVIKGRNRVIFNGSALVTVVLDAKGHLAAEPQVSVQGLIEAGERDLLEEACAAAAGAVNEVPRSCLKNDDEVGDAVKVAVRRVFRNAIGKKPTMQVHLVRI